MLKNDYVLRMIEELVAAIRRAVEKRRSGRGADAQQELAAASTAIVGLPLDALLMVDTPTLAGMLPEPERCAIAARLLKEWGELLDEEGDPRKATLAYKKAFNLYDWLDQRGALPREHDHPETLAWLVEELE
jgi:hypothetical protein